MYISEIVTTVPENVKERASLEQKVYQVFQKLGIPFERVDNDPAASMEAVSYTHLDVYKRQEQAVDMR